MFVDAPLINIYIFLFFSVEYLLNSKLKVLRVYSKTFEEADYPNPIKPDKRLDPDEKSPSKLIQSITLHRLIRKSENPYGIKICEFDSL